MTCNPAKGWVKDSFRDAAMNGSLLSHREFIESNYTELEPGFLAIIETLPEKEKQRYLYNDWNFDDDPAQLIRFEWVKNNICDKSDEATNLGLDVARQGNDRTVLAYRNGANIVNYEVIKENNIIVMAQIVKEKLKDLKV